MNSCLRSSALKNTSCHTIPSGVNLHYVVERLRPLMKRDELGGRLYLDPDADIISRRLQCEKLVSYTRGVFDVLHLECRFQPPPQKLLDFLNCHPHCLMDPSMQGRSDCLPMVILSKSCLMMHGAFVVERRLDEHACLSWCALSACRAGIRSVAHSRGINTSLGGSKNYNNKQINKTKTAKTSHIFYLSSSFNCLLSRKSFGSNTHCFLSMLRTVLILVCGVPASNTSIQHIPWF